MYTHTYEYTGETRPDGWGYSIGRVDEWMLSMFMPPPGMAAALYVRVCMYDCM